MIRQFRIHLNFLHNFVSIRGPLQGLRLTSNCGCCGAINTALHSIFSGIIALEVTSPWSLRFSAIDPVLCSVVCQLAVYIGMDIDYSASLPLFPCISE